MYKVTRNLFPRAHAGPLVHARSEHPHRTRSIPSIVPGALCLAPVTTIPDVSSYINCLRAPSN
ncbi:uncharacterized protein BKA78DRAFT_85397 [Phyllosticta capitalensis]|uniref:uncharacterized protein n=1 Tax=Phyllosticta capitalensis TaxID=121624 RepID=UPI0031316EDA